MPTPLDNSYWDNEESALWQAVVTIFVDAVTEAIQGAIALLPANLAVLVDYDLVNKAALDYARKYRYELIKGINDTTRKQVQELMSDWILSGDPLPVLEAKLGPIFGRIRAQMIASTEITRIFADANTAAWKATGFVSQNRWMTSKDDKVCPICKPRDGQVYALDDTSHRPPGHIRCRCWLLPVVDEKAVSEKIAGILA